MRHPRRALLALLLVAAIFAAGPVQPMVAYASLSDVEEGYVDEETASGDDDNDVEESAAAAPAANPAVDGLQNEYNQVSDKLANLKAEQKKIEANINSTSNEKEKARLKANSILSEVYLKANQIDLLLERISILEQDIVEKQEHIEAKQLEIDDSNVLLRKRLRAKYMEDDGTVLGLLLGSDSFARFLTRTEYSIRINEHDQNFMADLTAQRIEIEEEKAALEEAKTREEADKADVEVVKKELSVKHSEAAKQVADIERMEAEYLADRDKNKKLQDAAQAELKSIYDKIQWSKNPYIGGEMLWPLPGHYNVSSGFGSRFGGSDYHTGMDITSNGSGCYGSTIVAANAGTVKKVNLNYTPGVGYGIYVMIDHGGEMSTLYGHCSAILVSEGQEVAKGTPIAQVGSTGWSTGPHLHFEVRKGSTPLEPSQYLKAKK